MAMNSIKESISGFINGTIDIVHPSISDEFYKRNILPDNSINIIFPYEGQDSYKNTESYFSTVRICGQLTKKIEYLTNIKTKAIVIKLKPRAAGFFFNEPLYELTDNNVPLSNFLPQDEIVSIQDELQNTTNPLEVVIRFMREHLISKSSDKNILHSLYLIEAAKGEIRVNKLADDVCLSKRGFERRFRTVTGLTPKQYIKNTRFQYSLNLLRSGEPLLDVTYKSGYYDQSHFGTDFKGVTGLSPEQFAKSILSHFYY
jgi:AraC-like DNA-binding protein